jgi:hypothetical protein
MNDPIEIEATIIAHLTQLIIEHGYTEEVLRELLDEAADNALTFDNDPELDELFALYSEADDLDDQLGDAVLNGPLWGELAHRRDELEKLIAQTEQQIHDETDEGWNPT